MKMPVSVPNTSPSPSVSSILKNIRNRGMDSLADNNNKNSSSSSSSTNFILNTKRHALSASVPSIPLITVEANSTAQRKAIFENEIDLKNKVSNITKKFNNPENPVFNQQLKSKNKRREIFSSNRNMISPEVKIENQISSKNQSDCGGSWSKLRTNSINDDKPMKKDIIANEKAMDTEGTTQLKNLNEKSSSVISLDTKSSKNTSVSSNNIHSIRSSSSSVTVSGSSIGASNSSPPSPSCSSPTSSTKEKNMPFKIRSSKYRHVYGSAHKEDVCYKNIKITKNAAHDSAFSAVNPKFVAIVTEECGGGAFLVLPIKKTGRVDINTPKVCGHRGPVLDLKWNPFNDNEIASCSEDTTIKVWQIGDDGLYENLNEWCVDLHGHQRKVSQIEWHPTAENVMISSGGDFQVIVWNLEKAEPIRILTCHSDIIQSMNWMRDGSLFATTCKDKRIRLIDPRTGAVVKECDGHQGAKISKVIILGCGTKLFTTGFSKLSERQIALWDLNDLTKPIQMEIVDCSSGVLIPFYDHDTKIVFVAGKGDGNIRYYEITESEPYIHYLTEYKSSTPQRGLGVMPKRGLDVTKNEIYRFYKLHTTGNLCEPISMVVPRKSEMFQEDIYPDTLSGIPSMSCEEWINGENRDPILISLKDGAVSFMPKIVTYKQVGYSRLNTNYSRSFNKKEKPTFSSQKILRTNSISGHSNLSSKYGLGNNSEHNTVPLIEIKPIQKLNSNGRSAFSNYKPSQQHFSSVQNSPPSQQNSLSAKFDSATDSFSAHFNFNNNMSYNTEDLTLDAMVHANLIDGMSPNESVSILHESENSFKSIAKQNNDLEATYMTSVSKNPITLRKTESLKLDSVQSIRNRFDRMNTNTLGSLTRKHSTKQRTSLETSNLNSELTKSVSNSTESINNNTTSRGMNGNTIDHIGSANTSSILPSVSPNQLVQTDSSGSPTPLITSTASLSSSSSSSNTAVITNEFTHCSVKKRVWTPVTQSNSLSHAKNCEFPTERINGAAPANLSELQKSYFRVKDQLNIMEKRNKSLEEEFTAKEQALKEELVQKDKRAKELELEISDKEKRIEILENKLNLFLMNTSGKNDSCDPLKLSLSIDSDC